MPFSTSPYAPGTWPLPCWPFASDVLVESKVPSEVVHVLSVQTSKVKARFVEANRFRANHVKVVTENSIVYLLGIVKRQEANDATEIARTTSGVQRVVKVFEYLD